MPPSTLSLGRAIVEFPLACEGLAPLVEFTATELSARNLLKQVAHQAKQALEEAEKVRASSFARWHVRFRSEVAWCTRRRRQGRAEIGRAAVLSRRAFQLSPTLAHGAESLAPLRHRLGKRPGFYLGFESVRAALDSLRETRRAT